MGVCQYCVHNKGNMNRLTKTTTFLVWKTLCYGKSF
jgi:hypothetical protein